MLNLILQFLVSAAAIYGVILNNHRIRFCFLIWIFTNAAAGIFHVQSAQYGLLFRDLVFLILAVHGWFLWKKKG